jgi:hypothetical protein
MDWPMPGTRSMSTELSAPSGDLSDEPGHQRHLAITPAKRAFTPCPAMQFSRHLARQGALNIAPHLIFKKSLKELVLEMPGLSFNLVHVGHILTVIHG